MTTYTVGIVGTGDDPENASPEGFAMAYNHANAYLRLDDVELLACADIVPENADAFATEYDLDDEHVYESHEAMLEGAEPDIVSVTVPPAVHADVAVDCLRSDSVKAVHCEKPMALRWGDCRLMVQEAERHDVQLTFNHQRRFLPFWRLARDLVVDGEIGDLERLETSAINLYDWGTHCLDALGFYNDDEPAEWVLAGLDYREENLWFGAHNENQGVAQFEYANGVPGMIYTGRGESILDARHRLVGSEGIIEVGHEFGVRVRRFGEAEPEVIDPGSGDASSHDRAIEDIVSALREGRDSTLDAENALNTTEIIFAAWESVRRRGRVDLPLTIDDNPLEAMVEAGDLQPEPADD